MKDNRSYIILNEVHRLSIFKVCVLFILLSSCESLVEVEMPSEIYMDRAAVFNDEATARAAVIGMYSVMREGNHPFNGDRDGIADLAGLVSDELHYSGTDVKFIQFNQNEILADNSILEELWSGLYNTVYTANMIIENLSGNEVLSGEIQTQYVGEALFVRAFCHFYLINLFGDAPLVLSSDYRTNDNIPRELADEVYKQIKKDLLEAVNLLPADYPDGERVRPNKSVATALLARVCLFMEDWEGAEKAATEVISDSEYSLVDLNSVTLANNNEAIWQFTAGYTAVNPPTPEGLNFIVNSNTNNSLQNDMLVSFEVDDNRAVSWVDTNVSGDYIPYKYQVGTSEGIRNEYTTILRLGEQYLIRAEARAHKGDLVNAIADLDSIRSRANLPLLSEMNPNINQEELFKVVMQERRVELFTEWGHRWLDLKRTGQAIEILSLLKPGITETDLLWPIPQIEINNNPALRGNQNPGY